MQEIMIINNARNPGNDFKYRKYYLVLVMVDGKIKVRH